MIEVLLIEDSTLQIELITHLLSKHVKVLDVVTDIPTRFKRDYHVILTDLFLPKTEGVQTIKAIRAVYPVTPIVVITENSDLKLQAACLDAGASVVFSKDEPLETQLLIALRKVIHVESRKLRKLQSLLLDAERLLQQS